MRLGVDPQLLHSPPCGAIAAEDPPESFRVLVIDIDAYEPPFLVAKLGELPHGWGETFWIKEGEIVAVRRKNEHEGESLRSRIGEVLG